MLNTSVSLTLTLVIAVLPFANSLIYCDKQNDDICYEDQITSRSNTCNITENDFKSIITNSSKGSIELQFNLQKYCNITSYNFELLINESITETDCILSKLKSAKFKHHSSYMYSRIFDSEQRTLKCNETGTINLKYVYKGCYALTMRTELGQFHLYKFWNTDHIKWTFNKTLPKVFNDITSDSNLQITIINDIFKKNVGMDIYISCMDCTNLRLKNKTPYKLRYNKHNAAQLLSCDSSGNENYLKIKCNIHNETARICYVYPIQEDNYKFEVKIIDEDGILCNKSIGDRVWEDCDFDFPINYTSPQVQTSRSPPDHSNIIIMCTSLLTGFFLISLIIIVIYRYYNNKKLNNMPSINNKDESIHESVCIEEVTPNKILLLYARDTSTVMQAMDTFKEILSKRGFEIFDIYDSEKLSEILENPYRWLTYKLQDKHLKIIIVLTPCGQIVHTNSKSATFLYKDQECYDNIFPQALEMLPVAVTTNGNNYKKLLVMKFASDETDYSSFKFYSALTRFQIPNSFDELIRDLLNKNKTETENNLTEDERNVFNERYQNLKNDFENLQYLNDLLNPDFIRVNVI